MNLAHKNEVEDWIRSQRGSFDGVTCIGGWSLNEFSANARGRVLIAGPYPRDLLGEEQWYAYVEATPAEMTLHADLDRRMRDAFLKPLPPKGEGES